jgi:hypothetical protein
MGCQHQVLQLNSVTGFGRQIILETRPRKSLAACLRDQYGAELRVRLRDAGREYIYTLNAYIPAKQGASAGPGFRAPLGDPQFRAVCGRVPDTSKKPPVQRYCHGVRSVVGLQFMEHIANVPLNRILANAQPVRDEFVRASVRYELKHLNLPIGQTLVRCVLR